RARGLWPRAGRPAPARDPAQPGQRALPRDEAREARPPARGDLDGPARRARGQGLTQPPAAGDLGSGAGRERAGAARARDPRGPGGGEYDPRAGVASRPMTPLAMEQARAEDAELVRETLAGNQLSFQLLVERYQDRIFGLSRHYTK